MRGNRDQKRSLDICFEGKSLELIVRLLWLLGGLAVVDLKQALGKLSRALLKLRVC